jgi:hypothetical protein
LKRAGRRAILPKVDVVEEPSFMVEPIMLVGIGFLAAGLLVIGVIPLVHARAIRLTMRRMEALTPRSMTEIEADKDLLRAEFAVLSRRLEMSIEQMKAKTTSQLAEIGKQSEAIGRSVATDAVGRSGPLKMGKFH